MFELAHPTPLSASTHLSDAAIADGSAATDIASTPSTQKGRIVLDSSRLRDLRHERLMSQQDLADLCWRRNIQVSIATIKRAESGRAVRFRIARELARCFEVPVTSLFHV